MDIAAPICPPMATQRADPTTGIGIKERSAASLGINTAITKITPQ